MPRPFVRTCHHEVIVCFSSPLLPLLLCGLRNGILIIQATVAIAVVPVRGDRLEQHHESIASQAIVTAGGQNCVLSPSAPSAGETEDLPGEDLGDDRGRSVGCVRKTLGRQSRDHGT